MKFTPCAFRLNKCVSKFNTLSKHIQWLNIKGVKPSFQTTYPAWWRNRWRRPYSTRWTRSATWRTWIRRCLTSPVFWSNPPRHPTTRKPLWRTRRSVSNYHRSSTCPRAWVMTCWSRSSTSSVTSAVMWRRPGAPGPTSCSGSLNFTTASWNGPTTLSWYTAAEGADGGRGGRGRAPPGTWPHRGGLSKLEWWSPLQPTPRCRLPPPQLPTPSMSELTVCCIVFRQ